MATEMMGAPMSISPAAEGSRSAIRPFPAIEEGVLQSFPVTFRRLAAHFRIGDGDDGIDEQSEGKLPEDNGVIQRGNTSFRQHGGKISRDKLVYRKMEDVRSMGPHFFITLRNSGDEKSRDGRNE